MHTSEALSEPGQIFSPVHSTVVDRETHLLLDFLFCKLYMLRRWCNFHGLLTIVVDRHQRAGLIAALFPGVVTRSVRWLLDQFLLEGTPVNFLELGHLEEWLLHHQWLIGPEAYRTVEVLQVLFKDDYFGEI